MERIKNIVSFLYPVIVEAKEGKVTPYLEVTKQRGKYVLNSQNANYSFGGLHVIFDVFFKKIDISKYDFKNVLILGMGAGSIITLLTEKFKYNGHITAVEKDEVVIEFAKKYFNINRFSNLTIIKDDAFKYVCESTNHYDLIIIDLFVDGDVPEEFASEEFLFYLRKIASDSSCVIYNKMTEYKKHKIEFQKLAEDFGKLFPDTKTHKFNVYGMENSLLYYNTLPIKIKVPEVSTIQNHANQRLEQILTQPSF